MRDPDRFTKLAERLVQGGGSSRLGRRCAEELRVHWEDLRAEALGRGQEPDAAAAWADAQLGDLEELGRQYLAAVGRRVRWWQHPALTFGLLPPVAFLAWFVLAVSVAAWLDGLFRWTGANQAEAAPNFPLIRKAAYAIHYGAVLVIPALLCWRARGYRRGRRWALVGCACCSLHGVFHILEVTRHSLTWSYGLRPDPVSVVVPWLVFLLFLFRHDERLAEAPALQT